VALGLKQLLKSALINSLHSKILGKIRYSGQPNPQISQICADLYESHAASLFIPKRETVIAFFARQAVHSTIILSLFVYFSQARRYHNATMQEDNIEPIRSAVFATIHSFESRAPPSRDATTCRRTPESERRAKPRQLLFCANPTRRATLQVGCTAFEIGRVEGSRFPFCVNGRLALVRRIRENWTAENVGSFMLTVMSTDMLQ